MTLVNVLMFLYCLFLLVAIIYLLYFMYVFFVFTITRRKYLKLAKSCITFKISDRRKKTTDFDNLNGDIYEK